MPGAKVTEGGHDRFQRLRQVLGRGPLCEAVVALAEDADAPVAPGLLADPVDQGRRVRTVVLDGHRMVGAASFIPGQPGDTDVAVRGRQARAIRPPDGSA